MIAQYRVMSVFVPKLPCASQGSSCDSHQSLETVKNGGAKTNLADREKLDQSNPQRRAESLDPIRRPLLDGREKIRIAANSKWITDINKT